MLPGFIKYIEDKNKKTQQELEESFRIHAEITPPGEYKKPESPAQDKDPAPERGGVVHTFDM